MIRNRVTPEGIELGFHLARFCDDEEPKARLIAPEIPARCQSCAFREGPHLANGSPQTQMDALKCVIEHLPFYCHQPNRKDADGEQELCAGWVMMMLGAMN